MQWDAQIRFTGLAKWGIIRAVGRQPLKALITGAGGFVGGHLCQYLLAHTDWEMLAGRWTDTRTTEEIIRDIHDARTRGRDTNAW